MPSIGKILFFFSSWSPAYAIMALIAHARHPQIAMGFAVLTGLSIIVYFIMERAIFSRAQRTLKVKSIGRRDENILMYVIAYLPPFFAVDFSNPGVIWALLLFYVVFSITYVKLDLYYLNPMFIFRSYRTYDLVSEGGSEYIALIRGEAPAVGEAVQYRGRDHILVIDGSRG